jgi:hypothetical protein
VHIPLTDQVNNPIGHTESTSSLDTSSNILDGRTRSTFALGAGLDLFVNLLEISSSQHLEAGSHPGSGECLDGLDVTRYGDLDLQGTLAESEREDLLDGGFVTRFGDHVLA